MLILRHLLVAEDYLLSYLFKNLLDALIFQYYVLKDFYLFSGTLPV